MKLLDSDLKEYQRLCKKHFGEDVSVDDAREQLSLLVRQMEIVYQPVTVAQFDSYLMKYVNEEQNNETPTTRH